MTSRVTPSTADWESEQQKDRARQRLRSAAQQVANDEAADRSRPSRVARLGSMTTSMPQVALAEKVTGVWANITEVARKREAPHLPSPK